MTIYNIGVIAMPTLVKAAQVARARGQDWNKVECIPADIDLPDKYMFRSIFVCPVSKEEATPENPPMMLTCGHALCRETTKTLAKPHGSFKCPYCPAVSTLDGCLELHL